MSAPGSPRGVAGDATLKITQRENRDKSGETSNRRRKARELGMSPGDNLHTARGRLQREASCHSDLVSSVSSGRD